MPIFVSFIEPELKIQGPLQQFIFDPTQPLGTVQLWTQFIPTPNMDSNVQLDLINNGYSGYRMGLDTSSTNSAGMWHFSQISWNNDGQQSNYSITPLITFNENESNSFDFQGYTIGGVKDPIDLQDVVTLGYFNTHGGGGGGSGTVTSIGIVSTSKTLNISNSPITISGNIELDINPNLVVNSLTINTNIGLVSDSYVTSIGAAANANQNTVFNLPSNLGSSNQFLSTDGKGNTNWSSFSGGVTSIGISSTFNTISISGSPITSAGVIELDINPNLKLISLTVSDTTGGQLHLIDTNNSNELTLAMSANQIAANLFFAFPANTGTSNQFLATDGKGNTSWGNAVTNVNINSTTNGLIINGSPITTAGTITINLGTELQGLSALTTNGLVARTASGIYTSRSLVTDISGNIQISNGNGVTDNPSIGLNPNPILSSINFRIGSFYYILSPPAAISALTNWIFPASGTKGQFLTNSDGKGATAWGNVLTSIIVQTTTTGLSIAGTPIVDSSPLTINLNAELQALSAINTLGLVTRTAAGTYICRNISSGSSNILITNSAGTNGNPTIMLASNLSLTGISLKQEGAAYICGITYSSLATTNINLVLPPNLGTKGYVLSTDGGGNTSWINSGGGGITSITAGVGLNGGTITSSGTISLANTAVTPGDYTVASITVDAQGRITKASSGSGGTGVYGPTITTNNSIPFWNNTTGSLLRNDTSMYLSNTDATGVPTLNINYFVRFNGLASDNLPSGQGGTYYTNTGQDVRSSIPTPYPVGIYVKNAIYSPNKVLIASSKNIKNILSGGEKIEAEAIELFNKISYKKYNYKDKILHGDKIIYGMIAEELREVAPDWVSDFRDFLPNIMQRVKIISTGKKSDGWYYKISFDDDIIYNKIISDKVIKEGDKIKLIDREEKICSIDKIDNKFILVKSTVILENDLFAYGTYGDCPAIAKDNVFELGMVVLQKLIKEVQEIRDQLKFSQVK